MAVRTRPTTQADIARATGVSRGLVSMALSGSGRMKEDTRAHILEVARALDYHPNTAAAELAARRSHRLAVVLPYLDNPFFDRLLRRLRHHAGVAGHTLVVLVSDLEDQLERTTVDEVLSMRPAGLILPGTSMSPEALLGMSGATLRRHLAAEDTSLRELLVDVRMGIALNLLYGTQLPLKTVAARVGYRSPDGFVRAFRARYGLEPSQLGRDDA